MPYGPLSLLGDAIARGTGQMAAIRLNDRDNERRRQEDLEDYNRRRQDSLQDYQMQRGDLREDVEAARKYEADLYNRRRMDHIKDTLIMGGYLDPADAENMEAISAALERLPNDEDRRALDELAAIQTALMRTAETTGEIPGMDRVFTADFRKAEDMAFAKKTLGDAVTKMGKLGADKRATEEDNKRNAAAVYAMQAASATVIENDIVRNQRASEAYMAGDRDDELMDDAQSAAQAKFTPFKGENSTEQQVRLGTLVQQELATMRYMRASMAQRNADQLNDNLRAAQSRISSTAQLANAGVFGYLDQAAPANSASVPTAAPAALVGDASNADTEAFARSLGDGGTAGAPPPAPSLPAAALRGGGYPSPIPFGTSVVPDRTSVAPPPPRPMVNTPPLRRTIEQAPPALGLGVNPDMMDGEVARLRQRAAKAPAGTQMQRNLLAQADQIERSLAQRRTSEAQASLGVGY